MKETEDFSLVRHGFQLGSHQTYRSPAEYENEWRIRWRSNKLFEASPDTAKKKFFICVPYSYQNGPLHLGHGFTFTRGDAIARYMRMRGFNVLFPWAWHWTGEAVAGTSERLKRGDASVIRMLRDIDGIPEELIPLFKNPPFICAYYTSENRAVVDLMGWSVDWSREFYTTSLHPYYSKFIEWQYMTLKRKGLLVMGRHPVVWCPVCQSATGDHDRLSGEGIYPEEYTAVFFSCGDYKLAAATLRPETIYGATNVWVNPESEYVKAQYGDTALILSRKAAENLALQWEGLKVLETIPAEELIGKRCRVPLIGREIPVLPARFVDPTLGTGVVYSVPAHAPYDYAALRDLQKNPGELSRYGLSPDTVLELKPISLINVPGYGEFPAVEIVERYGIAGQDDERLEDATREVYSEEFHRGVMRDWVVGLGGQPVSQARNTVKEMLVNAGEAAVFYGLSGKVVCRSGDECVVKIVEDQWFLKFSDGDWKRRVREHINNMEIYPPTARQWFLNVVDWLHDWACTRRSGLGTKLPWDESWIIETLSDSTIYPSLYTISSYLNRYPELGEKAGPELFDYVFLGEGDPDTLSARLGIPANMLKQMREEFLYWYPVDLRVSAKDLVQNHLTFYIFHHVGIFPQHHWPRGVSVNGLISIEGAKMSKSRGNFITLKQAISRYGADPTRLTLLLSAEDMDDPDWREKNVLEAKGFLSYFLEIIGRGGQSTGQGPADRWLESMLQLSVKKISDAMDNMKTRTAASEAVYGLLNLWRWWVRRGGGGGGRSLLRTWTLLLTPFAPFTAEEAWRRLGFQGYASLESWPRYDPSKVDFAAIMFEEVIKDILDDVREIVKLVKNGVGEVFLYTASADKVEMAEKMVGLEVREAVKILGDRDQALLKQVPRLVEVLRRYVEKTRKFTELAGWGDPEEVVRRLIRLDRDICLQAAKLLEDEVKAPVRVLSEEEASKNDPAGKAARALPLRPAVYVAARRA
ncbi:Valine--tRNA ligase [archaeon HR01]|nr:Valine--tRNA ligase [archaeon HR01]